MHIPQRGGLCPTCKLQAHQGRPCPFVHILSRDLSGIKDFMSTSPPTIFVGRYNYPDVNVGVMSPINYEGDIATLDNHYTWFKQGLGVSEIAALRGELINSRITSNVKRAQKTVGTFQELAMAKKETDLEIHLKKSIAYHPQTFANAAPMGPNVELKTVRLAENVRVLKPIEKAYYDIDLRATDALGMLYKKGIDELKLARILSGGILGVKTQRKLVPTRWSITAVDDTLGKQMIHNIKAFPGIDEYRVFFGSQLGNHYAIVLMPGPWSYELFEFFENPHRGFTTDYESPFGRTSYASQTAGGYYAARLAILDYLQKNKRCARALVLRKITRDYFLPLGVWQVRENMRKAFNFERRFDTLESGLLYAKTLLGIDPTPVLNASKLIAAHKQPTLNTYF
ncbi:hypothetical protein COT72_05220 [archaeon CG10_big_fil_rev_8_21_14_0_10_43_11]|nr:MAG: hypothetical protein COT72_05220 [archaeon CG10_big_fil_rev_8_21_14_0_10_43_11]